MHINWQRSSNFQHVSAYAYVPPSSPALIPQFNAHSPSPHSPSRAAISALKTSLIIQQFVCRINWQLFMLFYLISLCLPAPLSPCLPVSLAPCFACDEATCNRPKIKEESYGRSVLRITCWVIYSHFHLHSSRTFQTQYKQIDLLFKFHSQVFKQTM